MLRGYYNILHLIPCKTWRETQLKIIHRTFVPFLSDKNNSQATNCLLYSQPRPSLAHRIWTCAHISAFWDWVLAFILGVTSLNIPKDPLFLVFGFWDPTLQLHKAPKKVHWHKTWILFCLLVARRTILKQWTSPLHPTITLLKRELTTLLFWEKNHHRHFPGLH